MNILFFGASSNITSAFGKIIYNVSKGLRAKGFNVYELGLQNRGLQREKWQLPLIFSPYGEDAFSYYLKKLDIECVITLVDNWMPEFTWIPKAITKDKIWVCHTIVNTVPVAPKLATIYKEANILVSPSKFSEKQLIDYGLGNIVRIPHGVNSEVFKPFSKEKKEKLKKKAGYKGKFVFLYVGTNKGFQKGITELLYAFKLFLVNSKQDAVLHLHCYPSASDGINLELMAQRLGIADKVFCTQGYNRDAGFEEKQMAELYNMADVFVTASRGESFCLPVLESMACGIPVVATDCTALTELVQESGAGLLAKPICRWATPLIADKVIVDELDFAKCLGELYNSTKKRKEMGEKGRKYAKQFSWEKAIDAWVNLMKGIENRPLVMDYATGRIGI